MGRELSNVISSVSLVVEKVYVWDNVFLYISMSRRRWAEQGKIKGETRLKKERKKTIFRKLYMDTVYAYMMSFCVTLCFIFSF